VEISFLKIMTSFNQMKLWSSQIFLTSMMMLDPLPWTMMSKCKRILANLQNSLFLIPRSIPLSWELFRLNVQYKISNLKNQFWRKPNSPRSKQMFILKMRNYLNLKDCNLKFLKNLWSCRLQPL
jgi:hypothetical protein